MSVLSEIAPLFAFKAKDQNLVAATKAIFKQIVSSVKLTSRSAEAAAATGDAPTFEIDRSVVADFDWFRVPTAIQSN